jgi:hypothetical protein
MAGSPGRAGGRSGDQIVERHLRLVALQGDEYPAPRRPVDDSRLGPVDWLGDRFDGASAEVERRGRGGFGAGGLSEGGFSGGGFSGGGFSGGGFDEDSFGEGGFGERGVEGDGFGAACARRSPGQAGTGRPEVRGERSATGGAERPGPGRGEGAGPARVERARAARGEKSGSARGRRAGAAGGESSGAARGRRAGVARAERAESSRVGRLDHDGRPARRPVRLTRRGRLVVLALVLFLGALVGFLGAAPGQAADPAKPAVTAVVQPGDTLWSFAERNLPHWQPKAAVVELKRLNDLEGYVIHPGQRLTLPARR